MKNTITALASSLLLISAACNKEDNGITLQPHDQDQMMTIMHQMMDTMMMMQPTGDPEIDFVSMMVVHHKGAINMANLELQQGKDDSLKRTAQKIINEQQAEIEEFNNYLSTHFSGDNISPEFDSMQMENMTEMGKTADIQMITGDVDNDFASLMITHHQGAISNAQAYLQYGNDPWLISKANSIINSQKAEVIEMSDWLIKNKR